MKRSKEEFLFSRKSVNPISQTIIFNPEVFKRFFNKLNEFFAFYDENIYSQLNKQNFLILLFGDSAQFLVWRLNFLNENMRGGRKSLGPRLKSANLCPHARPRIRAQISLANRDELKPNSAIVIPTLLIL